MFLLIQNARLLRNFSLLYLLNKHSYIKPYLHLYDFKKKMESALFQQHLILKLKLIYLTCYYAQNYTGISPPDTN